MARALPRHLQRLPPAAGCGDDGGARRELKTYELRGFTCFAAPAGTPPDIVKKLSDTIVAGRDDPKVKETMNQFFLNPPIPHAEAQKLFAEQTPLWVQFMEGMGIKAE